MIRAIASVIRGEGIASAVRRANERISDSLHGVALRARSALAGAKGEAAILNVAASGVASRRGGIEAQLVARLRAERALRSVALLYPGILELSAPRPHAHGVARDLEAGIREALAITGARTVHFEGTSGVPLGVVLRLLDADIRVILSIHDFSLFCARPHLFEEPTGRFCFYSRDLDRCHRCLRQTWDVSKDEQRDRRTVAREVLRSVTHAIFPSQFLLDQHRELFSLPQLAAEIIEPGVPPAHPDIAANRARHAIAYAGSVKRHKGAHLLPDLARLAGNIDLHVFGGGDEDLLRAMRRVRNIKVHGYYPAGQLPSLLARYDIALVVIPAIVPESYSLVLSEAWQAGAVAAAFDLGAQAERIRRDGGGWLAPLDSGAAGLAETVDGWRTGGITAGPVPAVTSSFDAAQAHVEVYQKWGMM